MTPKKLAFDLGIDPKRLRKWLREKFPRRDAEHGTRWHLTPRQVDAARKRFGR